MELHEQPPLDKALREDSELVSHFSAEGVDLKEFLAIPFEQLQGNVRLSVEQMQRKYPRQADKIQIIAETLFGPVMIDEESLVGKARSDIKAAEAARVSHNLAHAIIYAGNSTEPSQLDELVHRCLVLTEAFCARNDSIGETMRAERNGIKAQLAIMRTLRGAGFRVNFPDYTKTPKVLDWDVRSGIDLVARPGMRLIREEQISDDMVCIDSKSKMSAGGGIDDTWERFEIPPTGTFKRPIVRSVIDSLYNEGPRRVFYTILCIAPSPHIVYGLNLSLPPKEALRRYGAVLDENVKRRIVAKVKGQAPVRVPVLVR